MKRFTYAGVAVALLLSACTSDDDPSGNEATEEVTDDAAVTTVAQEPESSVAEPTAADSGTESPIVADGKDVGAKKIGVVQICQNCEGMVRVQEGIEAAGAALGWEVELLDAQSDPARALTGVENFIQTGVDGIILGALGPSAVTTALEQAADAGIPVITIYGGEASPLIATDVTTDSFARGGEIAGRLADAIGYSGQVAFHFWPLTGETRAREAAIRSTLGFYPDISIACEHEIDLTQIPENTRAAMETCLQQNPDLKAVIVTTAIGVEGTIQAIADAGLGDQVQVFTMDCFSFDLAFIADGAEEACTGIPYSYAGWLGIDEMRNVFADGAASAPRLYVPDSIVTADNLPEDEYYEARNVVGATWEDDFTARWGV